MLSNLFLSFFFSNFGEFMEVIQFYNLADVILPVTTSSMGHGASPDHFLVFHTCYSNRELR